MIIITVRFSPKQNLLYLLCIMKRIWFNTMPKKNESLQNIKEFSNLSTRNSQQASYEFEKRKNEI